VFLSAAISPLYEQDNEGVDVAKFMQASIQDVLAFIGNVAYRVALVDPWAYDAIRCKMRGRQRTFQLHFIYKEYGWDGEDIGPILDGSDEINWKDVTPQLHAMGITVDNVKAAMQKKNLGKKVTLSAGARAQPASAPGQIAVTYRQDQSKLETDEQCVIKAGASAIATYNPVAAEAVMDGAAVGRLTMKTATQIMRRAGVCTEIIHETDPQYVLTATEGVFLTQLVDGNGCTGHAIAIDANRGVIIDPAEQFELPLSLLNLDKCCGLASLCSGLFLLRKLDIPTPRKSQSCVTPPPQPKPADPVVGAVVGIEQNFTRVQNLTLQLEAQFKDLEAKTCNASKHTFLQHFIIGRTVFVQRDNVFQEKHNIPGGEFAGRGVYSKNGTLIDPMESTKPQYQKDFYALAKQLLLSIDADYAANDDWVVQVTIMDSSSSVKLHKDSQNVSFQYGVWLGDFEGGQLEVAGQTLDVRNKIYKMDGRVPHRVLPITEGKRYSLIYFKNYDRNITSVTQVPIVQPELIRDVTPDNLVYLADARYGGWRTFTAHLAKSTGATIVKVVDKQESIGKDFGYGCQYTNMVGENVCKLPNLIITAVDREHRDMLRHFPDGTRIVIHDPNELKDNVLKQLTRFRVITIRTTVQDLLLQNHGISSEFIPHPFVEYEKAASDSLSHECVSVCRLASDKNIPMILDTNSQLQLSDNADQCVHMFGHEEGYFNTSSQIKKRQDLYDTFYEGKFENTTMQPCSNGESILQNAKFVIDLSVIKQDGGGTQYTFLEAIHEDCVLVLHKDWVSQGDTFRHGVNCLAVSSADELAAVLSGTSDSDYAHILQNSKEILKAHVYRVPKATVARGKRNKSRTQKASKRQKT
jgi:hypothetical protein